MKVLLMCLSLFLSTQAFSMGHGKGHKGFKRHESIITPKELKSLIKKKDPKLVIIAVASPIQYRTGHIPGSHQIWRGDYTGKSSEGFGGMLASKDTFQKLMRSLGVDNDSKVVLYDHKYDSTRVWWAFFKNGKKDIRILDGGIAGWKASGGKTNILAPSKPKAGNFTAKFDANMMMATMKDVQKARKNTSKYQIWDTRETKEWTGEQLKKGAYRKGRIPGAEFMNWQKFRDKKTGEFYNAKRIKKVIAEMGIDKNKKHIFYCQSGVRTTVEMFSLYLMGWPEENLLNYDGSWIEWSFHKKNPVAKD